MKIPQLQERLMKGEENTNELAEFARFCHLWFLHHCLILQRFRKAYRVQGLTMPRVLKVWYWTGYCPGIKLR
jgi:hypothetical protein